MGWGAARTQPGGAEAADPNLTGELTAGRHSDVLIVGAGSAGSVIAERLSADTDRTVTVLEAGVGLVDPGLRAQLSDGLRLPIGPGSRLVRRYATELTRSSQFGIVRGATLGGSGAINGGYFCRGLPEDFAAMQLPGWSWIDVLGHFRAIETDLDFHGPVHGRSGPIPVTRCREFAGVSEQFISAAGGAGFGWVPDLNGVAPPAGVGPVPLNIIKGVRAGPGVAYLRPALDRANLTLLTETQAVRVQITGGRATGVLAVGPDGAVRLTADRIVLCAGAIESAHLLMLSGVGDEAMLRAAGVEVLAALPVGLNFVDHPEWVVAVDWPAAAGRPVLEAVLHTGDNLEIRPYTSGFAAMLGDTATGGPDLPHVGVALMQPRARGRLTLLSADPRVAPRIEHRYDSEPDDVAVLRLGVGLVREIIGSTAEVGDPVRSTSQHLCGTAPMGVDGDTRAVLDPQCRVRGVDGLWVVDGSVLSEITSRGPHATIVMIGHRAAEFIRC